MSTRQLSNGNTIITAEVGASRTDLNEWKDATITLTAAIPPPGQPDRYRDADVSIAVEGMKRELSFSVSPNGDITEAAQILAWLAGEQLASDAGQAEQPGQVQETQQVQEAVVPDDDIQALADQFEQLPEEQSEELRVRLIASYQAQLIARIMALKDWSEEWAGLLFPQRIWDALPDHDIKTVPAGFEAFSVSTELEARMSVRFPEAWQAAKESVYPEQPKEN